jgi:hypothetical protein
VQGLLEALVEEGILSRLAPLKIANVASRTQHLAFLPEEEARPVAAGPRSWNPDPGPVLRELSVGELPLGYVETLMPVHRIAHSAALEAGAAGGLGGPRGVLAPLSAPDGRALEAGRGALLRVGHSRAAWRCR